MKEIWYNVEAKFGWVFDDIQPEQGCPNIKCQYFTILTVCQKIM
jgi:hypothetical protein